MLIVIQSMVSIIIPAYNKGSIVFKTLTQLIISIKKFTTDFEIIVVNDGSQDNTIFEAEKLKRLNGDGSKVKIYNYAKNIGKGFALQYGFNRSLGNKVVFFDGDLDIDTSQVVDFLKVLLCGKSPIVIGSKYHKKSRISYPLVRYICSLVLRIITRTLFNLGVTDTQVGIKAFNREVLEKIIPRLIVKRFAFDLELLVVANMYGYSQITEMPVTIKHVKFTSTVNLKESKNYFVDILAIWYRKNILHYYDTPRLSIQSTAVPTSLVLKS